MAGKSLTTPTSRNLKQILPSLMRQIGQRRQLRPDIILAEWPQIIGQRFSPMTKAVSFEEGVLTIKVKNSSLLSLLTQHEKPKLLKELRKRFPSIPIRNIRFIVG